MNKQQRLIVMAAAGLGLLIAIIIYNLSHGNPSAKPSNVPTPPVLPDTSNAADIAWFNEPKATPTLVAHTPLTHPLPIHIISTSSPTTSDSDQRALQAPISSNQIRVEPEKNAASSTNTAPVSSEKAINLKSNSEASSQTEKTAFLKSAEQPTSNYLTESLRKPRSPYEIKTGTIIPAILISGINSDLPGPIIAQVRENVFDSVAGRYLLIPQGTKLQGIYDSAIAYGQQRVLIAWQRLIFPNGQTLQLAGMPGVDVSGYAGFKDQINNHYQRLFGSALLMSLISAGLQLSQPQQSNNLNNQPSVNQVLAQNAGISLAQTTDQLLRKNLNVQPTLEIRPGYLFNVSVTQDILFPGNYLIQR